MWTARCLRRMLAIALGLAIALTILCLSPEHTTAQDTANPDASSVPQTEAQPDSSTPPSETDPAPDGEGEAATQPTFTPPGLDLDLPPELFQFFSSRSAERTEQAPVHLDGNVLLYVAAPADPGILSGRRAPAQIRAMEVEQRIKQVATQSYTPETLRVDWDWTNGYPLIYAAVQTSDSESEMERLGTLLTVTTLDAHHSWLGGDLTNPQALRENMAQVAENWTSVLQQGLVRFKRQRQSEFLIERGKLALGILVGMLVLSLNFNRSQNLLRKKRRRLTEEAEETERRLSSQVDQTQSTGVDTSVLLEEKIHNQQRQAMNSINRRLLQLGQIAIWVGGLFMILGLFPYTRWLQLFLLRALQIPGQLTLLVIVVYLLMRVSALLIDRAFVFLQHSPRLLTQASPRRILRFSTFSSVIKSVVALFLGLIGFFIALHILGVNVAPLLAGAGLVGFAISFAAQNLIRDLINGFLILIEDQYGVGDVIILGDVAGFVEYMGLRITQLRNEEGRLITIPNGTITVVQNLTKEWSRVDLMIDVAHTADIDQAIALVQQVANAMSEETPWSTLILETPLMLGVDRLDHMGATIRLWITTKPLKQWDVAREYRRRLKIAFDQQGIDIGVPQQAIRFSTALDVHENRRDRNGSFGDNNGQDKYTHSEFTSIPTD